MQLYVAVLSALARLALPPAAQLVEDKSSDENGDACPRTETGYQLRSERFSGWGPHRRRRRLDWWPDGGGRQMRIVIFAAADACGRIGGAVGVEAFGRKGYDFGA